MILERLSSMYSSASCITIFNIASIVSKYSSSVSHDIISSTRIGASCFLYKTSNLYILEKGWCRRKLKNYWAYRSMKHDYLYKIYLVSSANNFHQYLTTLCFLQKLELSCFVKQWHLQFLRIRWYQRTLKELSSVYNNKTWLRIYNTTSIVIGYLWTV